MPESTLVFLKNGGVDRSSFSVNLEEQEIRAKEISIIANTRFIDHMVRYCTRVASSRIKAMMIVCTNKYHIQSNPNYLVINLIFT
ncbi:MAG: hypothetical protein LBI29_01895 [Rickettsiales bacterium]|nr:hypothetical protein [Rickettsiales bacterium]